MWKTIERGLRLNDVDDSNTRRMAITLYAISIILSTATGLLTLISIFAGWSQNVGNTAASFLISLCFVWLTWRGKLTWVRLLFPFVMFVAITFIALKSEGINDEVIFLYPAAIALAGLVLERKGVIVFTLFSMVAIAGVGYVELAGNIPRSSGHISVLRIATIDILISLTGGIIYLAIHNLVTNLERMHASERALAKSNQELQAIQASLEEMVSERTHKAEQALLEAETANHALQAQIWLIAGQAQLSERIRGEQDVTSLAKQVLHQLCRYLGAQLGVLFLAEQDCLRQVGSYALVLEGPPRTFHFGEGIIGQAAQEKQIFILDHLPPDFVRITSGLGDTPPRQILIAPFQYNHQVMGVLELATLGFFPAETNRFLEATLESIGVAFHTCKTRQQVNALLQETQLQAEELQAQQEELRATNEELEAQAENLRLSEARLREKQAELEKLNVERRTRPID